MSMLRVQRDAPKSLLQLAVLVELAHRGELRQRRDRRLRRLLRALKRRRRPGRLCLRRSSMAPCSRDQAETFAAVRPSSPRLWVGRSAGLCRSRRQDHCRAGRASVGERGAAALERSPSSSSEAVAGMRNERAVRSLTFDRRCVSLPVTVDRQRMKSGERPSASSVSTLIAGFASLRTYSGFLRLRDHFM